MVLEQLPNCSQSPDALVANLTRLRALGWCGAGEIGVARERQNTGAMGPAAWTVRRRSGRRQEGHRARRSCSDGGGEGGKQQLLQVCRWPLSLSLSLSHTQYTHASQMHQNYYLLRSIGEYRDKKKYFSFIQEQELTCDSAMMAGSLLPHGFICSSATTIEEERNKKNPNKTNTEKTKQEQVSYAINSWTKERGIQELFLGMNLVKNPEGIPGDNSTGHEVPKNQVLLGRCSSFFLPILLSLCSVSGLRGWRREKEMEK
jgi:hypothetical protein